MRDRLTNVAIDDRRRPDDLLGTWKWIIQVFSWKSEYENETDNKNPGESCPDDGRDFTLWFRSHDVQVTARGILSTQERALFAWELCSLFYVGSNHGGSRGPRRSHWRQSRLETIGSFLQAPSRGSCGCERSASAVRNRLPFPVSHLGSSVLQVSRASSPDNSWYNIQARPNIG